MKRTVAMSLIFSLLAVSSLPLLPASVICADAAERIGNHAMVMQTGIEYGIHHNATLHQHNKQLTPAEKECRIECGDGCHASLDGLPHQLAPHALAPVSALALPLAVIEPALLTPWIEAPGIAPPSPPPRFPLSELS